MDGREIRRSWYQKAEKDFDAAQEHQGIGTADEYPAFMCHQAIEKLLVGYLISIGEVNVSSHDLPYLGRCVEKYIPETGELKAVFAFVNKFYLEMTYPDDMRYSVTTDDVNRCIRYTDAVLEAFRRYSD